MGVRIGKSSQLAIGNWEFEKNRGFVEVRRSPKSTCVDVDVRGYVAKLKVRMYAHIPSRAPKQGMHMLRV